MTAIKFLIGVLILTLAGAACLTASRLDRDMAKAQQDISALNYEAPKATFDTAERYFEYASHLPWIGNGPLNDVRARKAALQYWQQQYGSVVPQQTDPLGSVPADNLELQLVIANAAYRAGQPQWKDKQTTVQALDASIANYLTVLKNAPRQEDAAYNYEYLVRLRDDIAKGRKAGPPDLVGPNGRVGGAPLQSKEEFKVYIPLDSTEIDEGANAGKNAPIKRKG